MISEATLRWHGSSYQYYYLRHQSNVMNVTAFCLTYISIGSSSLEKTCLTLCSQVTQTKVNRLNTTVTRDQVLSSLYANASYPRRELYSIISMCTVHHSSTSYIECRTSVHISVSIKYLTTSLCSALTLHL